MPTKKEQHPPQGLQPPAPAAGTSRGAPSPRSFGGYKKQDAGEFTEHAEEIKQLAKGHDIVEGPTHDREKRPAAFDRKGLQVVRSWSRSRPLEPTSPAAALVEYPRMWTTKRGRYAKFRIPGAGTYGILRARPTF